MSKAAAAAENVLTKPKTGRVAKKPRDPKDDTDPLEKRRKRQERVFKEQYSIGLSDPKLSSKKEKKSAHLIRLAPFKRAFNALLDEAIVKLEDSDTVPTYRISEDALITVRQLVEVELVNTLTAAAFLAQADEKITVKPEILAKAVQQRRLAKSNLSPVLDWAKPYVAQVNAKNEKRRQKLAEARESKKD